MRVIKRSGRIEDMKFDNVTNRIKNLTYGLSEKMRLFKGCAAGIFFNV